MNLRDRINELLGLKPKKSPELWTGPRERRAALRPRHQRGRLVLHRPKPAMTRYQIQRYINAQKENAR